MKSTSGQKAGARICAGEFVHELVKCYPKRGWRFMVRNVRPRCEPVEREGVPGQHRLRIVPREDPVIFTRLYP